MELTEPAVKKKAPTRRGTTRGRGAGLTTDLRGLQDSIKAFAEALPFAKPEADKLLKRTHKLIDRVRHAEAQAKLDDAWLRAYIAMMTGGRIERHIRELPEKEADGTPMEENVIAKAKFRAKGWRT
jgi:hypothetical protein